MYFTIEAYRERIEKTGATVRTFDGDKFIKAFISGRTKLFTRKDQRSITYSGIIIPSVLEQIEGEQFDYMIHDSMFGCGRLLAQILNSLPLIPVLLLPKQKQDSIKWWRKLSENIPKDIL